MGHTTLICITILFLSVFSCGSSHKKTSDKNHQDSVKKTVAHHDTTPKPPLVLPGLAPNTARIRGKILDIHASGDKDVAILQLEIMQVLGTGSATPLLSPKDTLLAKTYILSESFKKEKGFIGILKHQQGLADSGKTKSQWQLIKIKDSQDKK